MDERQVLRKFSFNRHTSLHRFAASEDDHLPNRLIDIQLVLALWALFYEIAEPADDAAGTIAVRDDVGEREPHLLQIRRATIQKTQCRLCIGDRRGDWLVHLMSYGR